MFAPSLGGENGRVDTRTDGPDDPPPDRPPEPPALLHERTRPDFRDAFGALARSATGLDVAVTRIRLTTLRLEVGELAGLRRLRLLLVDLRAPLLDAEAHATLLDGSGHAVLHHLIAQLRAGRVEVRSAPLGGWSPDFSIFHREGVPSALLLGPHWLERPYPQRGPAWGVLMGPHEAGIAGERFDELWRGAHDVSEALGTLLERSRSKADGAPADNSFTASSGAAR